MKGLLVAASLLLVAASGCIASQNTTQTSAQPATLAERTAANVPPIQWNVSTGVDWWSDFVTTYTKRDAYLANNAPARDHIAASMKALGFNVTLYQFPGSARGSSLPTGAGPLVINLVVATKTGTVRPDHLVVVGGHYDTQTATVQGAYDNGSGTAAVYSTCEALSHTRMQRSLVCLFFDGEELGTLGSQAYLNNVPSARNQTVDYYIGFDMVGINWPGHSWKMYNWVGDEFATDLFPFVNETLHQVLHYPDSGVEAFPFNDRNSDEATFKAAHVPSIRFAGGRTAGAYPQYHKPQDTVDFVYDYVGGRANFELGFGTIVRTAYQEALMLDQTSLSEIQQAYRGA